MLDAGSLAWYVWPYVGIVGGLVGFIGGFAGIGGLPIMVALLRSPPLDICQHEAQGTVLAVMLPPMAALGVWVMREESKKLWKHAGVAFVCYCATSYLGALLAYLFDGQALGIAFSLHMLFLSIYYFRGWLQTQLALAAAEATADRALDGDAVSTANPMLEGAEKAEEVETRFFHPEDSALPSDTAPDIADDGNEAAGGEGAGRGGGHDTIEIREGALIPFNYFSMAVTGAIIGVVGGLFGIGAGVFMVPIMTEMMGMTKNDARALSMLILLPPASAGAVVEYQKHDNIIWWLSAVLFGLYFVMNPLGAKVGRDVETHLFKAGQSFIFFVLGFVVLYLSFKEHNGAC
jgi:uncharacterized membrane protein YfcA